MRHFAHPTAVKDNVPFSRIMGCWEGWDGCGGREIWLKLQVIRTEHPVHPASKFHTPFFAAQLSLKDLSTASVQKKMAEIGPGGGLHTQKTPKWHITAQNGLKKAPMTL